MIERGRLVRYVLTGFDPNDGTQAPALLPAQRNVIERWFGRMKAFRRVATRYDKTSTSDAGFVAAAATLVALTGCRG